MVSAQSQARDNDKIILLFFTANWCVPCRIMKREVFADREVTQIVNSQIVPVMIDIDEPKHKGLLEKYNIGTTPITIFTDTEGKVLDYAVGKIGKTKFLEMFESLPAQDL